MSTSAAIDPRLPTGYIDGLFCIIGTDADHDVDVLLGECRDTTDVYDMLSGGTLTAAIDAAGLNGLDTGSVANNTWYALWLIVRTDTGAAGLIFSTSATEGGLTYPANYDVARRVGYVRTDGSANIRLFRQDESRMWWWESNLTVILSGGTATSFTDCNLRNGGEDDIAPSAVAVSMQMVFIRTTIINTDVQPWGQIRPSGAISDDMWRVGIGLATFNSTQDSGSFIMPTNVDGSRVIQYQVQGTGQTLNVRVIGWRDGV